MWMVFKAIEQNPKLDWKVGDACRARWSEDQVVYEATISTVDKSEGQDYAFVVFTGYENNDRELSKNLSHVFIIISWDFIFGQKVFWSK